MNALQQTILKACPAERVFLRGPAGCGKSALAAARLQALLEEGADPGSILLLTPQRSLQGPYLPILQDPQRPAGGEISALTLGGLAKRACKRFWPLIAAQVGFTHPERPPQFLTLETAQYYLARLLRPLLEEGFFESVSIDRNRLYSQILDNLNKAAVIGFPHTEIAARLEAAANGEPSRRRIFADAQECANRFRAYCLQHNLLDFSLQFEIFYTHLWPHPLVQNLLRQQYQHLLCDNVEEYGPRAQDLLREWLPSFSSALLLYDEDAGYRRFLGADPQNGATLVESCTAVYQLKESFVCPPALTRLEEQLTALLQPQAFSPPQPRPLSPEETTSPWQVISAHFTPQTLDLTVEAIEALLQDGLPPGEIAVLSPYISDALRFALLNRLQARGIPARSSRPSRSLREEPASQTLTTLAWLAHPHWGVQPSEFDVAFALSQSLGGFDPLRATLLAKIAYRQGNLLTFDDILPEKQERISYLQGEKFQQLRAWLLEYRARKPLPLDHFWRKLFGEILSQPGFGFFQAPEAIRVSASLIESARKFRLLLGEDPAQNFDAGLEYLQLLEEGVLAAFSAEAWEQNSENAVFVAPATTFLLLNRPVTVQFWLDPGASGWAERPAQPVTHPYVLERGWPGGRMWTDKDEIESNRAALLRLTAGLLRRCRSHLVLCIPELDERGYEQRGELLRALARAHQQANAH